jgi:hypothetical protein
MRNALLVDWYAEGLLFSPSATSIRQNHTLQELDTRVLFDMGSRPQYDLPTAVTFLMAGLGIGTLLAIVFSRRSDRRPLVPIGASPHASQ